MNMKRLCTGNTFRFQFAYSYQWEPRKCWSAYAQSWIKWSIFETGRHKIQYSSSYYMWRRIRGVSWATNFGSSGCYFPIKRVWAREFVLPNPTVSYSAWSSEVRKMSGNVFQNKYLLNTFKMIVAYFDVWMWMFSIVNQSISFLLKSLLERY